MGEREDFDETAVGRLLRADAEAACEEIRAYGIVCPSCSVNAADLPRGHMIALTGGAPLSGYAQCAGGQRVDLLDARFEVIKAIANTSLIDQMNAQMNARIDQLVGTGPADYDGLLSVLQDKEWKP